MPVLSTNLFLDGLSIESHPLPDSPDATQLVTFSESPAFGRLLTLFVSDTAQAEALLAAVTTATERLRERDEVALDAQAAQDRLDEAQAIIDATDALARESQDASESGDPVIAAAILNTPTLYGISISQDLADAIRRTPDGDDYVARLRESLES